MPTCPDPAITLNNIPNVSSAFDQTPITIATDFTVPNPLCGEFTTVFTQEYGESNDNLAALIQQAYSVPTTTISPTEPSIVRGTYSIRVTLTLDDFPATVETQVFQVTLLDPCEIATLSFSSPPFGGLPTRVALRDGTTRTTIYASMLESDRAYACGNAVFEVTNAGGWTLPSVFALS